MPVFQREEIEEEEEEEEEEDDEEEEEEEEEENRRRKNKKQETIKIPRECSLGDPYIISLGRPLGLDNAFPNICFCEIRCDMEKRHSSTNNSPRLLINKALCNGGWRNCLDLSIMDD